MLWWVIAACGDLRSRSSHPRQGDIGATVSLNLQIYEFSRYTKTKKIPVERGVNTSPPAKRAPSGGGARFHCKIFSRLLLIFPVTPSFSPGALLHFLTLSNFISPRSAPSFSLAASLRINPFTYAFPLIAYSSPNCAANVGIIFT